jgi:hypothetical protein
MVNTAAMAVAVAAAITAAAAVVDIMEEVEEVGLLIPQAQVLH